MDISEIPHKIAITYKKTDWTMDPKGYFLIDIDRKNKNIVVAHCKNDGSKNAYIQGSDPIALYYTIFKQNLVSSFEHAAYLGQELEKAFLAIRNSWKYVQDDILEPIPCTNDFSDKQKEEQVQWHGAEKFKNIKQKEYQNSDASQYH